jgi:hypothetical protein
MEDADGGEARVEGRQRGKRGKGMCCCAGQHPGVVHCCAVPVFRCSDGPLTSCLSRAHMVSTCRAQRLRCDSVRGTVLCPSLHFSRQLCRCCWDRGLLVCLRTSG